MNPFKLPEFLPLARYRFVFNLYDDLILPPYSTSTLRGIFGHSLRKIACMTKQKTCENCPLIATCPYIRIFANTENAALNASQKNTPPQAYIIEAEFNGKRFYQQGKNYSFDIVLIGNISNHLALIAFAFNQAFHRGVGKNKSRGNLINIQHEINGIWQDIYIEGKISEHQAVIKLPEIYNKNQHLHFETPVRLQEKGKILGKDNINATSLLKQLLRRFSTLMRLYITELDFQYQDLIDKAEVITAKSENLSWFDWARYSNRQQQEMKLGGVLGDFYFYDLPSEFSQIIYLGQYFHIGKETVFGLGKYSLKDIE
ncbi:MAG: CRISPR system precrRNA processing endoribonuclease RAMP protein Cas6 [Cardiobacteriaceae bacterium]|nr:CRISPR system precrRNA processing endoribonuclease RAMP protein Cas6 [Cardiobacteriaceae bacterium]